MVASTPSLGQNLVNPDPEVRHSTVANLSAYLKEREDDLDETRYVYM